MLIVMAGLPATGKSTIAEALARALPASIVSVDPIEAALWRSGIKHGQPTGLAAYVVAAAVADGVLALGQPIVVDAVNAVEPARGTWRDLARRRDVPLLFVEVTCSDRELHRARLESRIRDIEGFREPTWEDVKRRRSEFEPWSNPADARLVLDAEDTPAANVERIVEYLRREISGPAVQTLTVPLRSILQP
jgi:predicted kinase